MSGSTGAGGDVPARLQALRLRAALYASVRDFFAGRGELEVETPMLSAAGNTDPNIDSFSTLFSGHVGCFALRAIRASSIKFLTRTLASGWTLFQLRVL